MRAVWVDEGADADYGLLARFGVTRIYRSPRDPRTTAGALAADRARGYIAGIYRVPEWDVDLEPTEWAELLSDDVARLGGDRNQLVVQANAETHNQAWLVTFWTRWRKLRPYRATSWAFEGLQGGRLGVAPGTFRQQIIGWKIRLVPECYLGPGDGRPDMTPLNPDEVIANLCGGPGVGWGFPASIVSPFYDAARLPPPVWDGFAFTQQRLPR